MVKNGILYNTKYVSEMRVCDIPHVIVFSNGEPDRSKLSADRWDVDRLHGATMAAVPLSAPSQQPVSPLKWSDFDEEDDSAIDFTTMFPSTNGV